MKLVDFGLVKILQPDDARTVTVVQGRGTVAYTPLEQYGGDTGHTDVRTDIYSVGATLYHLLAGTPPQDAKERFLKSGLLDPLRQLNPDISTRTERAVFQALAMHPDERPPSILALREALFGVESTNKRPTTDLLPPPSWNEIMNRNKTLIGLTIALFASQLSSAFSTSEAYRGPPRHGRFFASISFSASCVNEPKTATAPRGGPSLRGRRRLADAPKLTRETTL